MPRSKRNRKRHARTQNPIPQYTQYIQANPGPNISASSATNIQANPKPKIPNPQTGGDEIADGEGLPRRPRGQRSRESQYHCQNKGKANLRKNHEENTTTILLKESPTHFKGAPSNNDLARSTLESVCPGATPDNTPLPDTDANRLIFRFDGEDNGFGEDHTSDFVRRFTKVVPDDVRDRLLTAWEGVKKAKVKRHDKKHHPNSRSMTTAYHFGVWKTRLSRPRATCDTRGQTTKDAKEAVKNFNLEIQWSLSPVIYKLMRQYYPTQLMNNLLARDAILSEDEELVAALAEYPESDFRGPFFTVAIKEGSSENPHIDWNDHPNAITWVIPIWDEEWIGGDLWVPQVKTCIPIRSGEAVALCTRHLIHCGTRILEGNRLVLTLFTDCALLQHGLSLAKAKKAI